MIDSAQHLYDCVVTFARYLLTQACVIFLIVHSFNRITCYVCISPFPPSRSPDARAPA